jgi:hypothetical protein
LVGEVLLDRSQRLLAGQKRRAHPRGGVLRCHKGWLLKLHFEHDMALIELWRSREITQREEKTGQHTKSDDPDPLDERMPETPKIEPTLQACEFSRQMR